MNAAAKQGAAGDPARQNSSLSNSPGSGDNPGHERGAFDATAWRQRMQRADIADELFLPWENGDWQGDRFRVRKDERGLARTRATGVRFLAADPDGLNLEPERATQNDLHRLLTSLIRLREETQGFGKVGLSGEAFRTHKRSETPRYRFGLSRARQDKAERGRDDRRVDDEAATAGRAYRGIRRSIRRAGFVVLEPTEGFRPDTGLTGLRDWTDRLRLRRRRPIAPWLLLLPLLLMPFLLPRCDAPADFFGAPIETRSFVLLIDRSGSMEKHFPELRREASRVLQVLEGFGGCSVEVIAYSQNAQSCLGSIQPISPATRAQIDTWLGSMEAGGGTNLQSGMELAAERIAAHGAPTTMVILTDAEDGSIPGLLGDSTGLRESFQGVETRAHALTPRFFADRMASSQPGETQPAAPQSADSPSAGQFSADGPPTPRNQSEQRLADLAELLGGRFGPTVQ